MLACFCLFILLHIYRTGLAVDALELAFRCQAGLLQLQQHKTAGHRNLADIMPRSSLYSNYVALLQRYVVAVPVISLAGILELDLNNVGIFFVSRHACKPVKGIQWCIHLAASLAADTSTAVVRHIFLIHLSVFYPNNHSQRHVEKDHFCIYILFNMPLSFGEFLHYAEYVTLVNKRREPYREVAFGLRHIYY